MSELYKKAGGTFVLKIVGLALGFVLQIFLGRTLGPELYGKYTMYLTYTIILSVISVFGMDQNLIKEVPKYFDKNYKAGEYLKLSLQISALIGIILSIVLLILNHFFDLGFNLLILILMLLIKTIITIIDGFLQGRGLVVKVTLLNIVINNIFKIMFFFTLIYLRINPLNSALYAFILSEVITLVIRIPSVISFLRFRDRKNSLIIEEKKNFIKYSGTVALIAGIGLLIQSIDKIMISAFLDLENVGFYKVSQNYVSLISVFIAPFIAFWPVISKLYHENKIREIEVELRKIVTIIIYLVIPMFFLFIYLSNDLLLIFGAEYTTEISKKVLIILSFSFLIDAISGPIGSVLTMTKYARYILYNNIISLILNLVLNYLLIKSYGIVGVAVATGISVIVNNLLSIIEVKLLMDIFSYNKHNVYQIIGLVVFNLIACWGIDIVLRINNNYLYIITFGLILYISNGIILYLMKRNELRSLLKVWRS
jgi:O-antigen/teichoic acid export membrane protein